VGGRATDATRLAAVVLEGFGASLERGRPGGRGLATAGAGGGRVRELPCAELELTAFPPGTLRYATALCLATAASCALLRPGEYSVDPAAVAAQLLLPQFLAASHDMPAPGRPPEPMQAEQGFVWCDLPHEDDRHLFAALIEAGAFRGLAPHEFARTAQECGLAVLDFRPRPAERLPPLAVFDSSADGPCRRLSPAPIRPRALDSPPLHGIRVCDMTAMWSGPLTTWLLASLGAEVRKIEPSSRLDGTRGISGGSAGDAAGAAREAYVAATFTALNRNKSRLDLDLRDPEQRAAFHDELSCSELLVSNFSPRASRNLGIDARSLTRTRSLTCLQMPAFPDGSPERGWRAYGSGVHAISGLGVSGDGRPWTAPAPYCDMLSGFAASAVAAASLFAMTIEGRVLQAEVPMLNVAARLARLAAPRPSPPPDDPDLGARFLAAHGERAGVLVDSPDGPRLHPRSPFQGPGLPLADVPAPELA
jgi:hypothetical protein